MANKYSRKTLYAKNSKIVDSTNKDVIVVYTAHVKGEAADAPHVNLDVEGNEIIEEIFLIFGTVALLFLFDKYCSIIE